VPSLSFGIKEGGISGIFPGSGVADGPEEGIGSFCNGLEGVMEGWRRGGGVAPWDAAGAGAGCSPKDGRLWQKEVQIKKKSTIFEEVFKIFLFSSPMIDLH
jgi:hypothetical protein